MLNGRRCKLRLRGKSHLLPQRSMLDRTPAGPRGQKRSQKQLRFETVSNAGRILLANSMLPLRPRLEGRPAALGYKAQADQSRSVAANSVSPEANSPTVSDRF